MQHLAAELTGAAYANVQPCSLERPVPVSSMRASPQSATFARSQLASSNTFCNIQEMGQVLQQQWKSAEHKHSLKT